MPRAKDALRIVAKLSSRLDNIEEVQEAFGDVSACSNFTIDGLAAVSAAGGVGAVLSALQAYDVTVRDESAVREHNYWRSSCGLAALNSLLCPTGMADQRTSYHGRKTAAAGIDVASGRHSANWQAAIDAGAASVVEAAVLCLVEHDPNDSSGRRTCEDLTACSEEVRLCHLGQTPDLYDLLPALIKERLPGKCAAVAEAALARFEEEARQESQAATQVSDDAWARLDGRTPCPRNFAGEKPLPAGWRWKPSSYPGARPWEGQYEQRDPSSLTRCRCCRGIGPACDEENRKEVRYEISGGYCQYEALPSEV